MIQFKVVPGKNCKNFITISNVTTKEDMELYDIVKKTLTRTEYKPFIQSFNKNISYNYLFNDYIFPAQFWSDVKSKLEQLSSEPIYLEGEDYLIQNDIDREIFDEWILSSKFPEDINVHDEKYKFQQDAVYLALLNKLGRIEVATSGGKTFITYMYCKYIFEHEFIQNGKKILVVVPSKVLANQLKKDFEHYDENFDNKIVVESIFSGSKKIMNANIVCGTFQSLGNYDEEYFEDFAVLICDELHRAKAYTIRNEIYAKLLNCEYYFGMTGTTPEYKSLDYLHIVSMFGPELLKRTAKENIDTGVSSPIQITCIQIYYNEYKDFSKNLKEQGIIGTEKLAEEKTFFHNYKPRTDIIYKLVNKFTDNTLILTDTVEYCSTIYNYLSERLPDWSFFIIHGNIDNREDIIDGMRMTKDKYCIIATYGTMSTGVSINNIGNLYFIDGGKSDVRIRQTIGRGMRLFPTKKWCNVFDFQDMMDGSAFKNHSRERIKIYDNQKFPYGKTKITI